MTLIVEACDRLTLFTAPAAHVGCLLIPMCSILT
jgi:hypothetical protein